MLCYNLIAQHYFMENGGNNMSVKFTVKMTENYMYDFMLYHTYTHISGLLGAVIGAVALVMAKSVTLFFRS